MKRCVYTVVVFVFGLMAVLCLLSIKVEAASTSVEAHLSDTPSGRILTTEKDSITGYTAYDLIRASMYEDIYVSMDEYIRTLTYNGQSSKQIDHYSYAFEIISDSWTSFLKEWWETSDTSDMRSKGKYLVFSVGGAVYSLSLDSADKMFSSNDMSIQDALREAFFECFMPYTVCVYSPIATSDVAAGISELKINSLGAVDSKNVFLEYIIHPILGVIPVDGNFSSPSSVYITYAKDAEYYSSESRTLPKTITHPLKMGNIFVSKYDGGDLCLQGSYDYNAWMLMHGVREDDVYLPVTVDDTELLPCVPFSLIIRSETARPYTYLYALVPVAYATRWVPSNTYGVYSMINRVYEKYEDGSVVSAEVTVGTSTLTYFSFETRNGCVGRVTPTTIANKDIYLNLNYLEIYRDEVVDASIATEAAVSYGPMGLSIVDHLRVLARPQMRSIVYINIQDGYYYRVSSDILYLQSADNEARAFSGYDVLDADGNSVYWYHSNNNLEWSVSLSDLMDESKGYQIKNIETGEIITVEEWLRRAEEAGAFDRLLYNYAYAGDKTPFSSDIVFDFVKLNKADTSFKFLMVSSNPNYRAYFSEMDSSDTGTAAVALMYGVSSDYSTWQLAHCEEKHLVAIPSSVYECIGITDTTERTDDKGIVQRSRSTTYMETGRRINIDYTGATAIDMTLAGQAFSYSNNNTVQAQGVFYNQLGRISTSKNPEENLLEHKMMFFLDSGHPTIVLSNAYAEQSGLLTWLQTNDAAQFMTQYTQEAGYSASTLYTRITTSGVNFGLGAGTGDDIDRLLEIEDELRLDKERNVQSGVFIALSFIGILMIAYAACLVIAYYLDIFNTFGELSILNIITFGGCRAVHTKQELADMGISDPKQQRRYVTLSGILVRWAMCTLFGILLFSSNKVFIWVMMIYEKLIALFAL